MRNPSAAGCDGMTRRDRWLCSQDRGAAARLCPSRSLPRSDWPNLDGRFRFEGASKRRAVPPSPISSGFLRIGSISSGRSSERRPNSRTGCDVRVRSSPPQPMDRSETARYRRSSCSCDRWVETAGARSSSRVITNRCSMPAVNPRGRSNTRSTVSRVISSPSISPISVSRTIQPDSSVESSGQKLVPYHDRDDIDFGDGLPAGVEVIGYVDDPVDVFFLHVQGSGTLVFPDGGRVRAGYAAHQRPRRIDPSGVCSSMTVWSVARRCPCRPSVPTSRNIRTTSAGC